MRPTERFEAIPVFAGLNQQDIGRILRITQERAYEPGAVIFSPGEEASGFYIVLEGKVEIRRPSSANDMIPLAALSNRSVFGEMAMIADRTHASAAVAVERTRLMFVPKPAFDALLAEGQLCAYKVVFAFAKLLGERLRRTEDELVTLISEMSDDKKGKKLAELQAFRKKLFQEWSF